MKKKIMVLFLASMLLTGCARDVKDTTNTVTVTVTNTNTVTITETQNSGDILNSLYTSLATEAPEDAFLLIINGADNVDYSQLRTHTFTIEGGTNNAESMLLVPKYKESVITIESVEYDIEKEAVVTLYEMFNSGLTDDGYGLRFNAFRPEGAPFHKITVTYNGETKDYIVTYNGKDGNPTFEYIE